jgi:hypothetical protein
MTVLRHKLHESFSPQRYDHSDVWAGNLRIDVGGRPFSSVLARTYSDSQDEAIVLVELYVRDANWSDLSDADLSARVWTDMNDQGTLDERGQYHTGSGSYVGMSVRRDSEGHPELSGNNLVLKSDPIPVTAPGVFHYSVMLSADGLPDADAAKRWIPLNDIAFNRDGQIVVSAPGLKAYRSLTEVCIRKVGARVDDKGFHSGKIAALTERLESINEDILYLLPFFRPGHLDLHSGEDVRKGSLGSVYAPKDFFEIDPDLVSSPNVFDWAERVQAGDIKDADLDDLLDTRQRTRIRTATELIAFTHWKELEDWVGPDVLTQLIGRAELRCLVHTAHTLGKRVIFDLILMQTSRDCELIKQHPEWYVLDADGRPEIHKIAWLVYSDVALLDLPFNRPLQNYLSGIAPFWIERCDFDGVRIDASQTVDRPFLKAIKNRIHRVKPDAIVLGETLCALEESQDIPVDMVYALLVDFHRDLNSATPLIDFVEETNRSFAEGTVALAYFENHDSPRATNVWRERYGDHLAADPGLAAFWSEVTGAAKPESWMALLKNLQASLINATIGNGLGTRTVCGTEWGTTWGAEVRTDFENPTIVAEDHRGLPPAIYLQNAYRSLFRLTRSSSVWSDGVLKFLRPDVVGDPDDRLLVYTKSQGDEMTLFLHNLDHQWIRTATVDLESLVCQDVVRVFDTHAHSISPVNSEDCQLIPSGGIQVQLRPLQSLALEILR